MRKTLQPQLPIVHPVFEHEHSAEIRAISNLLDTHPEIVDLVFGDILSAKVRTDTGREGMTAEQVFRAIIIKQMNGFSYEELAFHLSDSRTHRAFCRFGINEKPPSKPTLQRNIKMVSANTLEKINRTIIKQAATDGVESGRKVRVDCTGVESNIHAPSDSSLLWDCVRVMTRLMVGGRSFVELSFTDHTLRAKRRYLAIRTARTKRRVRLYRDLLKVTKKTISASERAVEVLKKARLADPLLMLQAIGIAQELEQVLPMAKQIIDQTQRRVLHDEKVPPTEKLVSIFEPHSDIIKKSRRGLLFGHKICLTTGASGIITDCVIEDGNPADATLALRMAERHKEILGYLPRQIAFDGAFASKPNLEELKEMGIQDVMFSKKRGLKVPEMVKSAWVYKRLRDFRAGIEAGISFLKRCFGLRRCTWKWLPSFQAYTWASVLSANLLLMARHLLE